MTDEGAWFLLRSFALAPLVLEHVYKVCYHFEAFCEAGLVVKAEERPTCPRCGRQMSPAWSNFRCTIPESMGGAWAAAEEACRIRGLQFSIQQEGDQFCVRLFDRATGNLAAPELYGEHPSLVLVAALVWEHLPEEERGYYTHRTDSPHRLLYHLEIRVRNFDGREEQTLAYISPTLTPILDFMARNRDGGFSGVSAPTWWWAVSLEEIGVDWTLHTLGDEVDDLWYYSDKGELMNYQPCFGYRDSGPIDPEYPLPVPPPEVAGDVQGQATRK